LLRPWLEQPQSPSDVQAEVQGFLLKYIGDPRLRPAAWFGVNEKALALFKRWLIGASLEAFFQIIEKVAEPGHWKYRKSFWISYFEQDSISDAWIVLGRDARRLARRFEGLSGNYGRLEGAKVLGNHCVLLMHIGDLVIADWSHNGKCRVWLRNDEKAPALYSSKYRGDDLRAAALEEISHFGSESGRWQSQISYAVRDRTGISVSREQYMP